MLNVRRAVLVVVALALLLALPATAWGQAGSQPVRHTVQAGENLYRIALKYGVAMADIVQANNITNPNLILVGQVLEIPGVAATATPGATAIPTATPVGTPVPTVTATATPVAPPAAEVIHVVQAGENLFRIALKYNLTTAVLAAHNGIANPNLIFVGQQLRIPTGAAAVPAAAPAPAPAAAATPAAPTGSTGYSGAVSSGAAQDNASAPAQPAPSQQNGAPAAAQEPTPLPRAANVGFEFGVHLYLPNQDMPRLMESATTLGVTWVKQQIDWSLYEPTAGAVNWAPIDEMVDAMDAAGVKMLLTITAAPAWARESEQEKGPPQDYQTYANFVGQLAARYAGRVDAYEIWNEQNLRREWNTPKGISAASYVELLRLAYAAIKNADPAALVVTGGLAPTGFNDGVNAIDDRVYLRQMYAAGVAEWSDAIGAHPNGWANPPDSTCCRNNRPAVAGWDEHPSFFFKQTLADYREIMVSNGDNGTYIWATQFGWGSNDGLNVEPAADYGFVVFTSLDEQASYTLRGFQLGRELGFVGPMFLWNLNYCMVVGQTGEQCLWSLLDPAGNPRPVYLALRDLAK